MLKSYFQTTQFKIRFLQLLARPIIALFKITGQKTKVVCQRKGINWELDLTEAIDFCLWLTHDYEPELTKSFKKKIRSENIIIDIGANSGIHTLYLAKLVGPKGKVFAIEPTSWGIQKIKNHLKLNPDLENIIEIHQIFLTSHSVKPIPNEVSASWNITQDINDPKRNKLDQGFGKSLEGAVGKSFDDWMTENKVSKIDFIKLDVDGHEVEVLEGAKESLYFFSPNIYMEISPIHYENHPRSFQEQINLMLEAGYKLITIDKRKISQDPKEIEQSIPRGVLLNVLGVKA